MTGAAIAAFSGNLTGNGPMDPREKKEWEKKYQARSIKIGEYKDPKTGEVKTKWLSYDRLEPFGQLMSAMADLVYLREVGQLSENQAQWQAGYLTWAIAMNFTNKTTMAGLKPLATMLNPRGQAFSAGNALAVPAEILNNFLPASGLRRQLANGLQPYMQEYNSNLDRVLTTATVGMYNGGANRVDWLTGEPITSNQFGHQVLFPLKSVERGTDPVRDALEDIGFKSELVMKELGGIELTADQQSRLAELIGGTNVYRDLKSWVTNPNFDKAVQEYKDNLRAGRTRVPLQQQRFYTEVMRRIRKNRDIALRQLKYEYPELQAQVDAASLENKAARMGLTDFPIK